MLRLPLSKLLSPPENISGSGDSSVKIPVAKTADDINDLFKELDIKDDKEVKEPVKEAKKKDDDKEVKEEIKDDEDLELIEPDENIEKLDLKQDNDVEDIEAPPRKKEILKEFPELFKKFPFLEKIMYRDKQYNELFGSFDDAKEIAEKSESFNQFESQLLSGSTVEILKNVRDADEKAFNIIVDEYLPTLAKVDKEAYFHVVGNLNRRLIMEMVQEANNTNNDDLKQAALLVNQFVFGSSKFTAPSLREPKKDSEEVNATEKERLAFVQERFESARDDLQIKVDNTLRATISDYIDPKNVMSAYVKKNAVSDAMKILSASIESDSSVAKNLNRLWKDAFDKKFSKEPLDRIRSYYLSKAKGNLKNAILKARAEALKDLSPVKKQEKEDEEIEEKPHQRTITPGKPSQPKSSNGMKKGESVADFFARD